MQTNSIIVRMFMCCSSWQWRRGGGGKGLGFSRRVGFSFDFHRTFGLISRLDCSSVCAWNMKVKIKKWHGVAVWSWQIDDEVSSPHHATAVMSAVCR